MSGTQRIGNNVVPMLTVAMSVLNGGEYLKLSVQSIIAQTYKDWELLIIDDGSTDGSVDQFLFHEDPRIIVMRDGKNKGLSARLNQSVDAAHGRYFARMDHDDVCHPNRFAEQVAFLDRHQDVDLVATKCLTINEQDQLVGSLPFASAHEKICGRPLLGFPMPHPSWMGRTSWFRRHRYQDPAPYCCEDSELLLRTYRVSVFHAIDVPLLAYRVRSHTPWSKLWKTRRALAIVQLAHFLARKEYASVVTVCVVTILRLVHDLFYEVLFLLRYGKATFKSSNNNIDWLDAVKVSSERMNKTQ